MFIPELTFEPCEHGCVEILDRAGTGPSAIGRYPNHSSLKCEFTTECSNSTEYLRIDVELSFSQGFA
jgi:hypothetical protein